MVYYLLHKREKSQVKDYYHERYYQNYAYYPHSVYPDV
jgi:hypothetical protein